MKSVHFFRFVFITFLLFASVDTHAQLKYLQNVNDMPVHPRILLFTGDEQKIKANIEADPVWKGLHQSIIDACDAIVPLPVCERILEGRRLLGVSREALRRIFYLSYAYRMTGHETYATRAEKEMLAVSDFSDWHPEVFLDVAEMTMAVAIGYDWLHDKLTPASHQIIRNAIISKGLDPSFNRSDAWFLNSNNNWNQVCNASMAFGALAVYEEMPELSKMIIDRAIESIHLPMKEYAPDGAYPEGYTYWDYGTSFNIIFLAAIEKIWATDFGLTKLPGFMKTGAYIAHMTGSTGLGYNYADNGLSGAMLPAMFWFAHKTNDISALWDRRKYMESNRKFTNDRLLPALMLWGSNIKLASINHPTEKIWVGRGITPVALMRTSWSDPNAIYVGFKGGRASSNHAHMDAGSFVMEANGVRWASDFGPDNYHSLESQGVDLWNMSQNSQRWQVFKYNNFAHNTLTVNEQLHVVGGASDIVSWSATSSFMNAISDLTKVFEGQLSSSMRGVAIMNERYVIIRDEVKATDKDATVRWTMLTSADVRIKGKNSIELRKNGKKLTLQVAEPANVTMKTWTTVSTNEYDAPNPGTILVGFEVIVPANTDATLLVKLIPQGAKNTSTKIPALKDWPIN